MGQSVRRRGTGRPTVQNDNSGSQQSWEHTDEPFVLASDVAPVFYVKDMSTKLRKRKDKEANTSYDEPKCHIVLMTLKRNIMGVDDKTDISEDYEKFDEIAPFTVNIDPSIQLNDEDCPWLRRKGDTREEKVSHGQNIPLWDVIGFTVITFSSSEFPDLYIWKVPLRTNRRESL